MRSNYRIPLVTILAFFMFGNLIADDIIPPYYKVGSFEQPMDEAIAAVKDALASQNFDVIGEYSPEGNKKFRVIAYTRNDLQDVALTFEDRGALASVLKIGLQEKDGKIVVSMLNPIYIFYAYFRDDIDPQLARLKKIDADAEAAMKTLGSEFIGFGGGEEPDDLQDYHYMAFMPYFDDPVELAEYDSFEAGLSTIRKNLEAKKGNSLKVYELVFSDKKVAVFGVGFLDAESGEGHFLPIIGEDNIAAMPYEIILQGNEATMLHGKYRIALHWPELSMSQFMKIMSTPGDIEAFLKGIAE